MIPQSQILNYITKRVNEASVCGKEGAGDDPVIRMFHCLFIALKISLFSMSSSHDLVIRMFHCLFIVLKISLFSMSSSHDLVIRMFHCLFIALKISLFSMSSSHDLVIRMFHCLFIVLKISLFSMSSSHDPQCFIVLTMIKHIISFRVYIKCSVCWLTLLFMVRNEIETSLAHNM